MNAEQIIQRGALDIERLIAGPHTLQAIRDAAVALQRAIVETVSQQGRGEPVVRYRPRRIVRPSLPGDPPAIGQGELAASITTEIVGDTARVGPTLPIAAAVEFGEADGSVLPRPFMHRSFEAARHEMDSAVLAVLRRATATGAT